MKRKTFITTVVILVLLACGFLFINSSKGWAYVKINDKTYVVNSAEVYKDITTKQISAVQYSGLSFLKPSYNKGSNKIPYGVPIYEGDSPNTIFVEFGDEYYKLVSTDTEGWQDGVKMKVENYQLVEP